MADDSDTQGLHRPAQAPGAPTRSPWWELSRRLLMAIGILVFTVLLVYFDRGGYIDDRRPHDYTVDLVDSIYYTTVTLSTTGYGDIAPVSDGARLINAFVITPLAHRLPGAVDRYHARGARLAGPRDVPGRPMEEEHGQARRRHRLRHQGTQRRRHAGQQRALHATRSSSSTPARSPRRRPTPTAWRWSPVTPPGARCCAGPASTGPSR